MTAYVNLPADSVGALGWIRGSKEKADMEREPITFNVSEREEPFSLIHLSSCLVLDLQLELFNFSNVAYEIKSENNNRVIQSMTYVQELGYEIEHLYIHKMNHTFLLILSRVDRIIVAFRGTTDIEHFKTDLKVMTTSVESALLCSEIESPIKKTVDWQNAMVHKGFADAYKSVSRPILQKLKELFSISPRPLFFTGHSLGGALATLCSLDIAICLDTENIYVSTFGSPKVGNYFWSRLYNDVIVAHWRVAMRSDIITTLPRLGYAHVGKRAALTQSGEIFLDPSSIETMMWSSAGLGISDHRKPAYKEAITLFCSKYLPNYVPSFVQDQPDNQSVNKVMDSQTKSILSIDGIPTMVLE